MSCLSRTDKVCATGVKIKFSDSRIGCGFFKKLKLARFDRNYCPVCLAPALLLSMGL